VRVLDIFSGIGGFSLGLERAGMETVAFCEYDDKCRQVLAKHWPDVPQYTDVRTLTGEQLEKDGIGDIGLICGGYPCQPFSVAGKRAGAEDDRHLWPEAFRLVQEVRPAWCLFENVAGHINMGLDCVLADLESEGYQSQTLLIPACAVGAPHRRDRVWIVAHSRSAGRGEGCLCVEGDNGQPISEGRPIISTKSSEAPPPVAHTECATSEQRPKSSKERRRENETKQAGVGGQPLAHTELAGSGSGNTQRNEQLTRCGECAERGSWLPEPPVGRVANGIPGRVDRLKQLGNAVVPQIPEIIGRAILNSPTT
jgi:DNA (cytosine-5)-methyltransferase 1